MDIDQCLFGYEDGHRLLASSMQLRDELIHLTELSDLVPGAILKGSSGYWTGVPAPKIHRYALMRTWPAPEMPRPGCVWTHTLLLPLEVFEYLPDLSILCDLFSRPSKVGGYEIYKRKFFMPVGMAGAIPQENIARETLLRKIIHAVYGESEIDISIEEPLEVDAAVFSVWSQQWPRLRRNFRFQTAIERGSNSFKRAKFDVRLSRRDEIHDTQDGQKFPWVEASVLDIINQENTTLRQFLHQYGNDVRKQKASFKPLVNIYLLRHSDEGVAGQDLLELITASFPERQDAISLKNDIVNGILLPDSQLDILWFILRHGGGDVFPYPSNEGVSRLKNLWFKRSSDLLHLAEKCASLNTDFSEVIFEQITNSIPLDEFWKSTSEFPRVRKKMLISRLEFLLTDAALQLDSETLTSILESAHLDFETAEKIIPKFLSRESSSLAALMFQQFPDIAGSEVLSAMDSRSIRIGAAWIRELDRMPNFILSLKAMEKVTRTSLLYEFADRLGWLSEQVLAAGTAPWLIGLQGASNDLSEDKNSIFSAFLIGLALTQGGEGGQALLEKFFSSVHRTIIRRKLPWAGLDILIPCLPDLGWTKNWDVGMRLRLATIYCYVQNGYSVNSFAQLTDDSKTCKEMSELAKNIENATHLSSEW